jgi:hypothetical protein
MHTLFVGDFDARISQITERCLEPSERETYDNGVRNLAVSSRLWQRSRRLRQGNTRCRGLSAPQPEEPVLSLLRSPRCDRPLSSGVGAEGSKLVGLQISPELLCRIQLGARSQYTLDGEPGALVNDPIGHAPTACTGRPSHSYTILRPGRVEADRSGIQ